MEHGLVTIIEIKVNGTDVASLSARLLEAVVETSFSLPGMFTLLFNDDDFALSAASSTLQPGAEVNIGIKPFSGGSLISLITGYITAIEVECQAAGSALLRVRGYDVAYKLTQGKHILAKLNATDSDFVTTILGSAGITGNVEAGNITHDCLIQFNQTNWEFILDRAHYLGRLVYVTDKTLNFVSPASLSSASAVAALEWGNNLLSFEPRLSIMGQLAKSSVSGWDVMRKQKVEDSDTSVSAAPFRSVGESTTGTAKISSYVNSTQEYFGDVPLATANEATTVAKARHMEIESKYIQAEGVCVGDDAQNVCAGALVNITINNNQRFSGDYLVTQARHEISGGEYTVWFKASGSAPETLLSLVQTADVQYGAKFNGVAVALVTNVTDPNKIGRVKVKYPWLAQEGSNIESDWARVSAVGAGKNYGIAFIPKVGDEVLVAFDHGDINTPFVMGSLWNGVDTLPAEFKTDKPNDVIAFRSHSGNLITLDDTSGSEKITIQDKGAKNSIVFDASAKTVTIKSEGDMTLDSGGQLILKSMKALKITSQDTATISAMTDAKISGGSGQSEVSLAVAGVNIKGLKVDVSATGMASYSANGPASFKSTAIVEIQGALVKIN